MAGEDDKKKGKGFFKNPFKKKSVEKEEEPVFTGSNPLYEGSKPTETGATYGNATTGYSEAHTESQKFTQGKETPVASQRSSRSGSTSSTDMMVDANELPNVPTDAGDKEFEAWKAANKQLKKFEQKTTAATSYNNMQDLETAKRANPELFAGLDSSPRGGVQKEQYGTMPARPTSPTAMETSTSPSTSPRNMPSTQKDQYGFIPSATPPAAAKPNAPATQYGDASLLRKQPTAPKAQHEQQYAMIPGEMKPSGNTTHLQNKATAPAPKTSPRALPDPKAYQARLAAEAAKAKEAKDKGGQTR